MRAANEKAPAILLEAGVDQDRNSPKGERQGNGRRVDAWPVPSHVPSPPSARLVVQYPKLHCPPAGQGVHRWLLSAANLMRLTGVDPSEAVFILRQQIITQEIIALHDAYLRTNPKLEAKRGRIFIAKAVLLLSRHFKSRDADHLVCLVHDQDGMAAERLDRAFMEARKRPEKIPLPEYTFDVHTARGRRKGKSKADFFREEFLGLNPKAQGEFDFLVEPQE